MMHSVCYIQRRDISRIKTPTVGAFRAYQNTETRTMKSYILDNVADDMGQHGGLSLCDAGLYDYAQTLSTQSYE